MINVVALLLSGLVYVTVGIVFLKICALSGFVKEKEVQQQSESLMGQEPDEWQEEGKGKKAISALIQWVKELFRLEPQYQSDSEVKWPTVAKVFSFALLWRIFLFFISVIAIRLFYSDSSLSLNFSKVIEHWRRWDAGHYLGIAEFGYSGYLENGEPLFLVFFPLYSYLVKLLHLIIPDFEVSALVVSFISYAIGCCYFYRLVCYDYGEKIAKRAVIYLSIFPFSFFFGGMMTESVFFMTCAAALYYIRRHQWGRMAVCAALCCLSRMAGLLVVMAAGIEMCIYYKPVAFIWRKEWKQLAVFFVDKVTFLFLAVSGTAGYLFINKQVTGNPFAFVKYQREHWFQGSTYMKNTLGLIMQSSFAKDVDHLSRVAIFLPEFIIFVFAVGCILYGLKKHYIVYVTFLLMYVMLNYSLSFLISGGRYMSCAIPMFVIMAEFSNKHQWADRLITVVSTLLLGIYLTGFLFLKNIM
ncbi:ArnT family glycosyltransferase [Anaeromicropila populeti]|uniref:Dolichyl-phosphate-mannose-protein mannosyltransferase n=1 Tax=Anaeromicropila populeti TaxID=37658 RepID=A0A1I6JM71_9FIRM|nr:glycosyltransferase family 39 protein [Anaeromicropila populeti]SFR80037.1 Dolichyl-phosphate-mannose-protein mannosyltransferase [Anaeromicropila populeti]